MAWTDKVPEWSPVAFLAEFAPIVDLGLQLSLVVAVIFPSYPRHTRWERDLLIWLAKEVFDKL